MLAIEVRLRFGTYDAGASDDPRQAEWPPEPSRIFCALVAGDPTDDEWKALEWLERQGDPQVYCAPSRERYGATQFVITNESKPGSPLRPGRTAKERTKMSTVAGSERFAIVWPDAQATKPTVTALQGLARRVPYVGRSTSQAVVDVVQDLRSDDSLSVIEPTTIAKGEFDLGTPYPGYSDALRALHAAGQQAWQARRSVPYRSAEVPAEASAEASSSVVGPLWRLLVLRADLRNTDLSRAGTIGESLRRALIARVADPPPPSLHGHQAQDRLHVAYLSLGNVGAPSRLPGSKRTMRAFNEHADGSVLAVALALPTDLPAADVAAIASGCAGEWTLTIGDEGRRSMRVAVRRSDRWSPPFGASPGRWIGPAKLWVTASPLVFDRFGGRRRSDADMVADAVERAGFPRPVEVWTQRAPMLPGAASCMPSSVMRRAGVAPRPFSHAWIRFEQDVAGPVLAGSMRYRGLGLFAPMTLDEPDEEDAS
ncbi:MAG: type I-U CRISPR-associated protein Csb2 [Nocardioidaceae bacterium]